MKSDLADQQKTLLVSKR